MEVIGIVVTGSGTATTWQKKNPEVLENLRTTLGWERIEVGTLNVKADGFRRRRGAVRPVVRCTVEGRPAVIVKFVGGCAEVMAQEHLRTALGLTDGDEVTLETDDPRAEDWT